MKGNSGEIPSSACNFPRPPALDLYPGNSYDYQQVSIQGAVLPRTAKIMSAATAGRRKHVKISTDLVRRKLSVVLTLVVMMSVIAGYGREAAAAAELGTVKEIRSGKLERKGFLTWKALAAGDKIMAGDRLRTDAAGAAVLTLDKVGKFLISPNTDYALGENPQDFKTTLHKGYVWIKTTLAKGAKMDVSTANAVAGIRGTRFSVLNDGKEADVCTCKGKVEVAPKSGKAVNVGTGMYSTVMADGTVEKPAQGKPMLTKLWKGKEERFKPCLTCHRKGKKARDL
jgi:hypothetical protein